MNKPRLLLIDNYDSFSFNLVDAFSQAGATVEVYRNSVAPKKAMDVAQRTGAAMIVLSPGPGTPRDAGCCIELIRLATGSIPIFGVCLGHQAIVEAGGGVVGAAEAIVHGKKSRIRHNGHPLFAGLPDEIDVGRYHSLIAHKLPDDLEAIALCGSVVMAIAHRHHPVYGVQFHPESILTTHGQRIVTNALEWAMRYAGREHPV